MTMEGDPVEQTEGFYARVYALVGQIPPGRVVSYGQIAWALGAPAYGAAGRLGHAALPGCAAVAAGRARRRQHRGRRLRGAAASAAGGGGHPLHRRRARGYGALRVGDSAAGGAPWLSIGTRRTSACGMRRFTVKRKAESSCSQPFVISVQPLLNSFACCLSNFFKASLAYLRHPACDAF